MIVDTRPRVVNASTAGTATLARAQVRSNDARKVRKNPAQYAAPMVAAVMSDLIVQADVSSVSEVPTNSDRPARKGSALPISRFVACPCSAASPTRADSHRAVRSMGNSHASRAMYALGRWSCSPCGRGSLRPAGAAACPAPSGAPARLLGDQAALGPRRRARTRPGEPRGDRLRRRLGGAAGLRDENDLAAPVARALAARHPDRLRLVVHEEESGANPGSTSSSR